jgi:hypothetical protein
MQHNFVKSVAGVLALVFSLELVPIALRAQDVETRVEHVSFEVAGELVRIYYDLRGIPDRTHKVRLALLRESDSLFIYRPMNITGDVGSVVFPGLRRRITWDIAKEFPEGLTGNDFYFVVEVERVETEGMNPLIWIGGGAVVVGGVLALVLGGKKSETPADPGFPAPPGRP